MKLSITHRRVFSTLFMMGYIFVAFFAQQLHHHSDIDFDNLGKTIIKVSDDEASDCLGCHVLHIGKYISNDTPEFQFANYESYSKIEIEHKVSAPIYSIHVLCLRGPPVLA